MKLQTDAGDPKAGLSEEERAGRDGQLAVPLTATAGTTQAFRPVMLDLDGDGIETTDKAHGVAFDVDDSGYLKQSAWLKGDDGFLVLDRNLNGQMDSGKEMFSNGTVDLSRRGLAGMAWLDANYDGRLSGADPVWNELKVWQDSNQNGVREAGEAAALSSLGITEVVKLNKCYQKRSCLRTFNNACRHFLRIKRYQKSVNTASWRGAA